MCPKNLLKILLNNDVQTKHVCVFYPLLMIYQNKKILE